MVIFAVLRLPHWFRGAVETQSRAGSRTCLWPADWWGQRGGQAMSLLLDVSRSSVCMGVLELVDIPAHWGSAMLLHTTFSFPSRCQPAPSTDPIPYPPAWVLGWGELVSWPWETLQPKPPPSGEAERRDSPAFHPWGSSPWGGACRWPSAHPHSGFHALCPFVLLFTNDVSDNPWRETCKWL